MSRTEPAVRIPNLFLVLLAVYCGASLAHFVHNAEFLSAYPNMPAWLSYSKIYLAWLGVTAIGVAGLLFLKSRFRLVGLLLVGVYAALGFDGLGHYSLAPMAAHTATMNATIWSEVVAAALLLAATIALVSSHLRRSLSPRG